MGNIGAILGSEHQQRALVIDTGINKFNYV